jgi:hypothetical protein
LNPRRSLTRLALLLALILVALGAASASASAAVIWKLSSVSNTTVAPGESLDFAVFIDNLGDVGTEGAEATFTATFPEQMTVQSAETQTGAKEIGDSFGMACTFESHSVTCNGPAHFNAPGRGELHIVVSVDPAAGGTLTASYEISGGGAPQAARWADPVTVTATEPGFGIEAFDAAAVDKGGAPEMQAGAHPYEFTTSIDFNSHTDKDAGPRYPAGDARDVTVLLPPGFVGSTAGVGRCTVGELAFGTGANAQPLCLPESQVGVMNLRIDQGESTRVPVFNMVPPPGVPARFGIDISGSLIILDTTLVRHEGEYRLAVSGTEIPQALAVNGNTFTFWGVPSDQSHERVRSCPGSGPPSTGGPFCPSPDPPKAFFRNPTSCSAQGLPTAVRADSWQEPGKFKEVTVRSHELPGYPWAPEEWGPEAGTEGCDAVPFEPMLDLDLTTDKADSPTGLAVDLGVPQDCWKPQASVAAVEAAICQSDLKAATVTLPEGLVLNPSAAAGREGCSAAEFGVVSPQGQVAVAFDEAPVSCPDASKIGTVTVETPLLDETLGGTVYLARQSENPFGSLLALYLVIEGQGIRIKQAGRIELGPNGRLTTTFDGAPQTPFESLRLELDGGPRAPLRTPAACGTYTAGATLTPWSGNGAVQRQSSFEITEGCGGGFDPKLSAGTENPLAGKYSPFNLQLSRADGTQELGKLQVSLPPGLVSTLRGYSYCPDSVLAAISSDPGTGKGQEASPSCPANSRVGSATVGAGAGVNPFYTQSGRAYLAGPYKGAPVSLAVVAPAVAGPFDLGSVVVRNAIHIDPTTAQLTIASDPLPQVLHGIPLDLRDVRVRYDYTLNPTSCEPFQIGSQITSTQGAIASPSVHFQAAGCDRLGFKPRLSLALKGPTHRAAHPALRAVLRTRPGDANIGATTVLLPKTELLENAHIRTICTRVQYAAAGGEGAGCPKGSVYGYARAWTPLLAEPLEGPVYLRSNGGERELPDLVAALDGQIHVDVVGYIDSVHQRIRNRFAIVPDAPVSKFELTMQGGRKGLLANNTELCRARPRAGAHFTGQNGKATDIRPAVRLRCKKGARRH